MKGIIVYNSIFDVSKEYRSVREVHEETGFCIELIYRLIESGEEKHGYSFDFVNDEVEVPVKIAEKKRKFVSRLIKHKE